VRGSQQVQGAYLIDMNAMVFGMPRALPALARVLAPGGTLGALWSKLKHGDTSQIAAANSQASSLQSTAGKNGYAYQDQQPSGFSGF